MAGRSGLLQHLPDVGAVAEALHLAWGMVEAPAVRLVGLEYLPARGACGVMPDAPGLAAPGCDPRPPRAGAAHIQRLPGRVHRTSPRPPAP